MQENNHKVSVVLLTKNSATTIRKALDSIFNQTRKPDEVIVVDGNSNDGTLEIVKQYPVKLVSEPGLGFGYARNLGVKSATGEIIFFIDSDCYAEHRWIETILPHFDSSNIAGVTGPTRLWNTNKGVARFLACVGGRMNMPNYHTNFEIAPTMNLAVRKDSIFKVGGFDETYVRCEDTDLTYKLTRKEKIVYEPEAVVWFMGSPTLKVASRKCVNHFIGVGQLFAKHGFNRKFVRFNLPIRALILIAAITSFFTMVWYVPTFLFGILLVEFVYKIVRMYLRYHDNCVLYYMVFFTFWSLASLAILYGLYLGIKQKQKTTITPATLLSLNQQN